MISFILLFIFCIMLSVGFFFFPCLNRFLVFHVSFDMDVFIAIINFLVLCSVFIVFNPKMFVLGLLSEFLLFDYGFKSVPCFFSISAVIESLNNCFVMFIASVTDWWYIVFAFSVIIFFLVNIQYSMYLTYIFLFGKTYIYILNNVFTIQKKKKKSFLIVYIL